MQNNSQFTNFKPSVASHPTRGAWIEIIWSLCDAICGASHPTRGAWIEIDNLPLRELWRSRSHPTRGAWIEMRKTPPVSSSYNCRTLPGVRGLKSYIPNSLGNTIKSHPTRGAWIEMHNHYYYSLASVVAPYPGCVD